MSPRETLVAKLRDRVAKLTDTDHVSLPVASLRMLLEQPAAPDPPPPDDAAPAAEPSGAPDAKPRTRKR